MDNDRTIIYNFLDGCEDFTKEDVQSGYAKVYRPSWHPHPMQFWFNPPFNEKGVSSPTLSNAVILMDNGDIMVEDVYTGLSYNLDTCLEDSIQNFVYSIRMNAQL